MTIRTLITKFTDPLIIDKVRYKKGIELVNSGNYQKAIEYFSSVLKKRPNNATALAYRGHCYLKTGLLFEALSDLTKALEKDAFINFAYSDRGMAFFKLEMYKEAYQEFTKAIEFSPNDSRLYKLRGLVAKHMNKNMQSRKDFQKAVELGDETCNYTFDFDIIDEF